MTNIQNAVWRVIEADPSIQLDLERKLVNVRALARFCRQRGVDGSEDAIISAIRRYPADSQAKKWFDQARRVVSLSSLSTKGSIAYIELSKGEDVQNALPDLFSCVRYEKGETLRLVQGEESIRLLVDEKNVPKILEKIPEKSVLKIYRNLAEINLHLHPLAYKTPGIVYLVSGELARQGINMYEMLGGAPELLVFLEEKDLLTAYKALHEICQEKNRRK